MKNNLQTTIGLEIHIQLNTQRKMFCLCSNKGEDESPNKYVCPICLAMPGTLPIPNKKAIESVVKLGLALGCEIAKLSKFDRKHYFYPDLPKGYQISQYDMPFVKSGVIELSVENESFRVGINRIHLEEDAGKLIHSDASYTVVDLNRAGTPLAELVTEPDIKTPQQAKVFMQELQKIVRSLGVSDANMEKGHMRCDANISLTDGSKRSPIVEIKNINSFKFVEKALAFERSRLENEFDSFSGKEGKITRGFDSKSGTTYALRSKEEAKDYRYFPEPDIPPFDLEDKSFIDIEKLKLQIPALPGQMQKEMAEIIGDDLAKTVLKLDRENILYTTVTTNNNGLSADEKKALCTFAVNNKSSLELTSNQLSDLGHLLVRADFPKHMIRSSLEQALQSGQKISHFALQDVDESNDLDALVSTVIESNQDAAEKFRAGKKEVVGFLIGQVMKDAQGKANPGEIRKILENKLGGK